MYKPHGPLVAEEGKEGEGTQGARGTGHRNDTEILN